MRPKHSLPLLAGIFWCATAQAAKPWLPRASRPITPEAGQVAPAPPPVERSADFRAALQRGLDLLGRGRYRQAADALGKATALCPDCAEAHLARARSLLAVGYLNWDLEAVRQALVDARISLDLHPGDRENRRLWQLIEDLWRRMNRISAQTRSQDKLSSEPGRAARK